MKEMTLFVTAFVYEKRRKPGEAIRVEAHVYAQTDVGAREQLADYCFRNSAKLIHVERMEEAFSPFMRVLSIERCPN